MTETTAEFVRFVALALPLLLAVVGASVLGDRIVQLKENHRMAQRRYTDLDRFDPNGSYEWWVVSLEQDTICCWCGGALEEESGAYETNVEYTGYNDLDRRLGLVPADWEDGLVHSHLDPEECSTTNSQVTVRTWGERG